MVQRAFQVGDRERRGRKTFPAGDAVQRSGQLCAGSLELEDELAQILVVGFIETQFVSLMPEPHRTLEAAMLERVAQIATLVANPINALPVRIGLGLRLVQCGFTRRVDLLDSALFLL